MIRMQDVAHDYGGGTLFSDVTLTLDKGSFHFLTGPSGSGKSTFLKFCYRALLPRRGTVSVAGQDLATLDRNAVAALRQRIGVVHQDCQFLNHLPLAENVALPLTSTGRSLPDADLTALLAWVGLGAHAAALPPTLSGGERQRAALARAVITQPDLLVADEPTGNLDWEMSQRLLSLLVELNRMGTTVLIASHDLQLIRSAKSQIAARVIRIAGRKLQLAGTDL